MGNRGNDEYLRHTDISRARQYGARITALEKIVTALSLHDGETRKQLALEMARTQELHCEVQELRAALANLAGEQPRFL